ncbi:hypothetical protein EPA93_28280 [Ktedonosporobacter rubrisoli]|uniref:Uncharacterized protein n=1 Tax=Ktedonosporobacter rubrisoli TaxID=2509675 RepID=A0A4P6JW23_KTERU|nr:hypothetical protein [Ktedonosporobacter rubrisoli]QBD79665.1 hypothetical protein EPA93_28280 [Ktedonosporobacter rubrisoli]
MKNEPMSVLEAHLVSVSLMLFEEIFLSQFHVCSNRMFHYHLKAKARQPKRSPHQDVQENLPEDALVACLLTYVVQAWSEGRRSFPFSRFPFIAISTQVVFMPLEIDLFLTPTAPFTSNESASLRQAEYPFLFGLKKRTKINVSFCDGRDEEVILQAEVFISYSQYSWPMLIHRGERGLAGCMASSLVIGSVE